MTDEELKEMIAGANKGDREGSVNQTGFFNILNKWLLVRIKACYSKRGKFFSNLFSPISSAEILHMTYEVGLGFI